MLAIVWFSNGLDHSKTELFTIRKPNFNTFGFRNGRYSSPDCTVFFFLQISGCKSRTISRHKIHSVKAGANSHVRPLRKSGGKIPSSRRRLDLEYFVRDRVAWPGILSHATRHQKWFLGKRVPGKDNLYFFFVSFSRPTSPTQSFIGLVQCVSFYTLSSPAFKGWPTEWIKTSFIETTYKGQTQAFIIITLASLSDVYDSSFLSISGGTFLMMNAFIYFNINKFTIQK